MIDDATLTDQIPFSGAQRAALEQVAGWIVRHRMTVPAILFFESVRPLNAVGAASMTFLGPVAGALLPWSGYRALRDALENRASIEFLLHRIEALDQAPAAEDLGTEQRRR